MRTFLIIISALIFMGQAQAAGGAKYPLEHAKVDLADKASLQRGAKYFVNYCMGCHSMNYQRFNRVAKDLDMSDQAVIDNLIFTTDIDGKPRKVGELMTIAMDERYAETAFGVIPPDLNLVARSRSPDWVYTYLKTFYKDDSRPMGVNNAAFPAVGMPNVLGHLQGEQRPVYEEIDDHGHTRKVLTGVELVKEGSLSDEEFDQLALDLTNFFVYSAEPAKMVRGKIGFWVILFLLFFTYLAYMLKKEYWKDIH